MFSHAYDIVDATAVLLFTGTSNDDGDYARYIATFQELDRRVVGRENPIGILVVSAGNPPPNALWRKRIAEAAGSLRSRPLMIVVSESALIRGVVKAISWVKPLPIDSETTSSFDEARAIAERRRGRALRSLDDLYRQARDAADAATRAKSRIAQ